MIFLSLEYFNSGYMNKISDEYDYRQRKQIWYSLMTKLDVLIPINSIYN
jgi:hypothetical protein